ncbi:MAG TPA: ATP-dependent DNA helicase [Actinomycetota bacterium]|nr:ATP-dependent DNA helicase [Actinomycetota bacterium]
MTAAASEAIKAALRGYSPSPEQWETITAGLEPMSIVAGAGSGKTAVMTARIVHLLEQAVVRPSQVLGLTFTNKAAGELESRLTEALARMEPHPREHPYVTTYNAFAQDIVRTHGPRIGVDSEAGLLTQAQKWQMLQRLVDGLQVFEALELRHPLSFIPQTLELADQCANHLVDPEELREECARLLPEITDDYALTTLRKRRDFALIIQAYVDEKRRRRKIDFGDQIALAVRILEQFPDVTAGYRDRFPVVLLDEYQDTNPAQKVMLQAICPPGSAVTAVGDARQAIFGWRGASMFNLIGFASDFPAADGSAGKRASLSANYRSGRRIVHLANRVIASVPEERRPGDELVAVPANGEGWVGAGLFSDQETEASWIADEIERLHPDKNGWRDTAVLLRSKRYMDRVVAVLGSRDIPVEMPELGGLLKIPAVVDTVAWLRLLSDPGPSSNRWLARILMGPRFRVHYSDIAPISRWAAASNRELTEGLRPDGGPEPDPGEVAFSLLDALSHLHEVDGVSDEARPRIREFVELLSSLRAQSSRPLVDLVQTVVERSGLADALLSSSARSAPAMHENLRSFLGVCAEFSPLEGEPTLESFLEFLDAAEESEDPIPLAASASSDSVKVMTIHTAKGLEFDNVFVPALAASQKVNKWDGLKQYSVFPDVRMADPLTSARQLPPGIRKDAAHLPVFKGNKQSYRNELRERAMEDERRLFYVAVTRARHRLYCSGAWWYGAQDRKGPSDFLEEVLGHADVVETICLEEATEDNPVVEKMRRDLVWPPPVEAPGGPGAEWLDRAESLIAGGTVADDVLDSPEARDLYEEHVRTIRSLTPMAAVDEPADMRPKSLPATSAVRIALSKEEPDRVLSPLPRRLTDAQRLGIEMHAWIEERARGLVGLADEEALDEASLPPDPEHVARMRSNYEDRYAARTLARLPGTSEPLAELPFILKVRDGLLVRGRIDAVYERDGGLEVVDFKTGAVPQETEWEQLELYAEALAELGVVTGPVTLTYAYLGADRDASKSYEPRGLEWLERGLATVAP